MPARSVFRLVPLAFAVFLIAPLEVAHAQDAEEGARVFRRCVACHTTEEGKPSRATGPNLFGVVGAISGTRDVGFKFSPALSEAAIEWNDENLEKWLENPRKFIKGARMAISVAKEQQRKDVIAYLKQVTQ